MRTLMVPACAQVSLMDGEHSIAATGCGDGIVRVWSLGSFACLRSLSHGFAISSVRLVHGLLLTGGQDGMAKVWHLAEGRNLANLPAEHSEPVQGLALAPNGTVIIAAGDKLTAYLAQ